MAAGNGAARDPASPFDPMHPPSCCVCVNVVGNPSSPWEPVRVDLDDAPRHVGNGIVLRELREGDVTQRASLGRRREIVRSFGGSLDQDQPLSEHDARTQLAHRFGPGPHWVRRAYRFVRGRQPSREDLVDIFDPTCCGEVVAVDDQVALVREIRGSA